MKIMNKKMISGMLSSRVFFMLIGLLVLLASCDSDLVKNVYTFKGETIGEYLEKRPEQFSEFSKLLDTTDVKGTLKTYVKFTCFAPNNEAMKEFYLSKGKRSLSDFPIDTLRKIAYDHLISGNVILSSDFKEGRLSELTMSERYISISFAEFNNGSNVIRVNKTSPILQKDDTLHNGVVHVIGEVLSPTEFTIVESIAQNGKFKLFYEALVQTGLNKQLLLERDNSYNPLDYKSALNSIGDINKIYAVMPQSRKYGYTVLLESDSTYNRKYGIFTLEQLKKKAAEIYDQVYPEDAGITDVTNPRNSLNRFIAYHLINKQMSYNNLIKNYDCVNMNKLYDMYEYIEPMCANTLLEVKIDRAYADAICVNKINSSNDKVSVVMTNYDNDATNGVYHEIDQILAYSKEFAAELAGKRLRLEGASFFPELTNNNIRRVYRTGQTYERTFVPKNYCKRLQCSENTRFCYLVDDRYEDFQGDEIWMRGMYDFSITTPPIPAGTYEVRFGYQPTGARGAAQIYWDSIPCGIPTDLRYLGIDPKVGYETPGTISADPLGYENDKMMRNRGYMKGPDSYFSYIKTWYKASNARMSTQSLRKILGKFEFTTMKSHTLTVKAIREGEFMFDYLELVPVEMLDNEDTH